MERTEIVSIINDFLVDEFEIESSKITDTANLKDDLGLESLDFVDIVVIIEKEFNFKVKREEIVEVRTLIDLYNYVEVHSK
jgi:acyl carrier protein